MITVAINQTTNTITVLLCLEYSVVHTYTIVNSGVDRHILHSHTQNDVYFYRIYHVDDFVLVRKLNGFIKLITDDMV